MRILFYMILIPGLSQAANPLYQVDFDKRRSSIASKITAHRYIQLVPTGGVNGTPGIRVAYVGSTRGSERVVMQFDLAKKVKEAYLGYHVLFEQDFQFVRGGKLHGLGPADPAVGGEKVDPDTWSARLMFGSDGALKTYNYHQRLKGVYGQGVAVRRFQFKKDRWYRINYHVKLNDPPQANGFVRVLVDGKPLLEEEGLRFRGKDSSKTLIQRFLFSTFHGGSSKSYAPKTAKGALTTVHARFDNFSVYPGRPGP
jgi:hypothetical protein